MSTLSNRLLFLSLVCVCNVQAQGAVAPVIIAQPENKVGYIGGDLALKVTATGRIENEANAGRQ